MATLTKHEVVLDRHIEDSLGTDFQVDPNLTFVWLPRQVYRDMGEPAAITVTVVPGDQLNGEDS